ncbi:hypothetical protein ACTXJ9_07880 [Brachybacterium tyrofermentans]|uniref:hypothetical protein n=1 Tax=Brachybacterium tyrofermentans TaxID=47848 RepID=UPI003FD601F6
MTTIQLTTRSECATCGTPMRRTWTDDLIDSTWRAVDGTIVGTAEDVPAGAPTNTPELLEFLAARGDMHSYSTVLARYQMGHLELPWEHLHRAVEPASESDTRDVPECHGWPMRAAPSAWICRVDGTITRRELAVAAQHPQQGSGQRE